MEKTFAQELHEIANKVKIHREPKVIVSPQSPQKRAEDFLEKLKIRLKVAAQGKAYFCPVLQIEFRKERYNNLDPLQKLIFDGCKAMGLKTDIQELNGLGIEGGSSNGRWITVSWKTL